MINWRVLAPLLTFLGGMPLWVFAGLDISESTPAYMFGFFYVSIIIAFIAGIDWVIAVEEQLPFFLIWSIILALFPVFLFVEAMIYQLSFFWIWLQLLLFVWFSLGVDRILYQQTGVMHYMEFRVSGTIVLSIGIIACMLRL